MQILKNSNNINKYIEKKSYSQPQLKEIGKVNYSTKGGSGNSSFDSSWKATDLFNISS